MIGLEDFIKGVKLAAAEAAQALREQNLKQALEFFDQYPPGASSDGGSAGSEASSEGGEPGEPKGPVPAGPPHFKPRLIAFEFPVETEDGPKVHTAYAPIISLIGHQSMALDELRLTLDVVVSDDDERKTLNLSFPPGPRDDDPAAARAEAASAVGKLEIVLKSADPPRGFYELIRGYDRALRANIPG